MFKKQKLILALLLTLIMSISVVGPAFATVDAEVLSSGAQVEEQVSVQAQAEAYEMAIQSLSDQAYVATEGSGGFSAGIIYTVNVNISPTTTTVTVASNGAVYSNPVAAANAIMASPQQWVGQNWSPYALNEGDIFKVVSTILSKYSDGWYRWDWHSGNGMQFPHYHMTGIQSISETIHLLFGKSTQGQYPR